MSVKVKTSNGTMIEVEDSLASKIIEKAITANEQYFHSNDEELIDLNDVHYNFEKLEVVLVEAGLIKEI